MAERPYHQHPDAIPLWEGEAPATGIDPGGAGDDRAAHCPALTPFLVPGDGPRALCIVCPGGGYQRHAAHEGEPVARWLNSLGLHAAVLSYRVWPWRYPAALMDAQRAIRLVRARAAAWKVDAARVGILGFSAGGHVACSAAILGREATPHPADALAGIDAVPSFLIACYPVVGFGAWRHDGSRTALLGADADPALVGRCSLERSVHAACPPAFLWHSANDQAVPAQNSLHLAESYVRLGLPVALHLCSDARHGVGLAEGHPSAGGWTGVCAAWLAERGLR